MLKIQGICEAKPKVIALLGETITLEIMDKIQVMSEAKAKVIDLLGETTITLEIMDKIQGIALKYFVD